MNLNLEKGKPILPQILKYKYYYLLIAPVILWYIIFHYLPMFGIVVAFQDYNPFKGFWNSEWVGFRWFKYLATAPQFFRVLRNTFILNIYQLIFHMPSPIIFALLLNECRNLRFKRVIQTVTYLPHFLSWAIVAGFVVTLLSPTIGVVNQVIKMMGGEAIYFMAEPKYIRGIMIISGIWKNFGWGSILYLAALSGINPELYESAILDGAGKFKQAIYITIPGISHIITLNYIFEVTSLVDIGFEQAYNLVNYATYDRGLVLSTYIYNMGIKQFQYSFTTAVGLAQSTVALLLLWIANKIGKKIAPEGAVW